MVKGSCFLSLKTQKVLAKQGLFVLGCKIVAPLWWTFRDSNPGPTGYEPVALTNWAKGPFKECLITSVKRHHLCQHRPILPGRLQPSIVGTGELNFRVRNGNGWTLTAKDADYEITGSDKQMSLASDESVHLTSVRSAAKHHRNLSCCLGDKIGENS